MVFVQEIQCFFLSLEWGYFAQRWCSSHMETLSVRQYSFQQVTQFSSGNKVLDPPASNNDSFLTKDTVLVPFTRMELFGTKVMFFTSENIEM
jgi:hypothetical protein